MMRSRTRVGLFPTPSCGIVAFLENLLQTRNGVGRNCHGIYLHDLRRVGRKLQVPAILPALQVGIGCAAMRGRLLLLPGLPRSLRLHRGRNLSRVAAARIAGPSIETVRF